jgi:hypothetical protein
MGHGIGRSRATSLASLVCVVLGLTVGLGACGETPSPHLEVDREVRFQGWGVSLAWWAELVGAWPLAERTAVARLLFGDPTVASGLMSADGQPLFPLGLNIARYNIGASGPGERCARAFRPGAEVPTVLPSSANGHPNLKLDGHQIAMLQLAQPLIEERHGVRSYIEAFANSPPWWLLPNRCPQGDGKTTVLAGSNQALVYAAYLAEVVTAFRREHIVFTSVDPVNEPTIEWECTEADACQEGAYFSNDKTQSSPVARSALSDVVQDTCNALGPLGVPVSTPDSNSPDDGLDFVSSSSGDFGCVRQINTHSYEDGSRPYTGTNRTALGNAVHTAGRTLWMSEFGNAPHPCSGSGVSRQDSICTGIDLAVQVADDLNGLAPEAWIYWTAMEGPDGWGLLTDRTYPMKGQTAPPATVGQDLTPSARFWALGQYTRFIPGTSTIVPVGSPGSGGVRTVVAQTGVRHVVVVATNPAPRSDEPLRIDLSSLGISQETPLVYRTDASQREAPVQAAAVTSGVLSDELPADSISTYVLGPNRAAGTPHFSPPSGPQAVTVDGIRIRDAGPPFPGIGATYRAFATAHRPPAEQTPPYDAFDPVDRYRNTFSNVGARECPTTPDSVGCIVHLTIFFPRQISLSTAQRLVASALPSDAMLSSSHVEYYLNHNFPDGECFIYTSLSLSRRMSNEGRIYVFYTTSYGPYESTQTDRYSRQRVTYAVLDAPGVNRFPSGSTCGNAS